MPTKGKVKGIIANLVIVEADGPVAQNEICMIGMDGTELMAEVIKVQNNRAFVQVFESTRGLKVGTEVNFTGSMLEVTLGPGILSRNYDGLQNDLDRLEGVFLRKGERNFPLDENAEWKYKPLALKGEEVVAGSWLGEVTENWMPHKIMVPFKFRGTYTVKWTAPSGDYRINDVIAILADNKGNEHKVTMVQKWPVKLPVKAYRNKVRPFRILETGIRVIDTLNPMAEGGTGFIPGPFGCGKTVLQHALSRQAEADMVVVAACGERANEVVEIFTEFPELIDARTGRKLIERTTIIANTSSMPVAAREASVYTAMTIAEYYRSMGLKILLLADSTSRWAQALREMSNRMEELPGPDAFPMDLPAIISNYYSRAGYVVLDNGNSGSITFIGTVSPAGGNLKEPVTESTKKTARCFYALSQQRSDSKRYPAIDPIDSYSKYLEYDEVKEYISGNISPDWVDNVIKTRDVLLKGREAQEQINILGDDGVPVEYHVRFWKSEVIDFIVLQQDAFDVVDRLTPLARQKFMLDKILEVIDTEMKFESFEKVVTWFKKLINLFKQMNYSSFKSDEFNNYLKEIDQMLKEISMR
ncbi:MAG TPA: V-type ATP synthase subunit A [Bacteroidales bacterium]|nr:V-type ATP synthase subunit A [Bacteroidales bacterium]HPF02352.1 V-type ATP synthase subunit A [Bacteroidales bacterium]HPJ58197.1 V-type ATP synthase subunit A [Bacteroidales bacterium]HPR11528.1 V-type ATP synthase subunit A [Bacteroidales bacterium]HRW84270.1 V-type ATP synthase subunit A [Bacteroidales bacterium]